MGRAVFRTAVLALEVAVNATVIAHQKNVRRAVNESESVLIDVHDVVGHAIVVYPHVRSYQAVPELLASQISNVSKKTRVGSFGSTAMPWSYQFCG